MVSFVLIATSCYLAVVLKQRALASLSADRSKIKTYQKWGYNTKEFERMYDTLLAQANATALLLYPFKAASLSIRGDNILQLVQAGYATEITKYKEALQARLSYLRERVKNESSLPEAAKSSYFGAFDVVAAETFETNIDLSGVRTSLQTLEQQDKTITTTIETLKTEALIHEMRDYKNRCEALYTYFVEKNSIQNKVLAAECINEAEKLLKPHTPSTASREHVFSHLQDAERAKQTLIQQEEYARELQKKEEERLSVVPPAPRQEGKVVVVNIALQRLYAYENGKTVFATAIPITTGKYGFETVTGEFAIYLKEEQHKMVSPFPGIFYDDVVNYWMPFYLGYGLHDAPWRSVYGTQDYPVVGSHGCVNIPLKETIVLYNWAEVGTRVIVI